MAFRHIPLPLRSSHNHHLAIAAGFRANHPLDFGGVLTKFFLGVEVQRAVNRLATQWRGLDLLAINAQLAVVEFNVIPRQADHPFDEITWIFRREEHHHVTALRLTYRNQGSAPDWQAQTVVKLADQNKVALDQSRLHRRRRNLKRFGNKGAQHKHNGQYREKGFALFNQKWLFGLLLATLGKVELVSQRNQASDKGGDHQDQGKIDIHKRQQSEPTEKRERAF